VCVCVCVCVCAGVLRATALYGVWCTRGIDRDRISEKIANHRGRERRYPRRTPHPTPLAIDEKPTRSTARCPSNLWQVTNSSHRRRRRPPRRRRRQQQRQRRRRRRRRSRRLQRPRRRKRVWVDWSTILFSFSVPRFGDSAGNLRVYDR